MHWATCRAAIVGAISKVDRRKLLTLASLQSGGGRGRRFGGAAGGERQDSAANVPLINVAGKTRHMPDDFLDTAGTQLSANGRAYFDRLVPKKYDVGKPFV